MQWVAIERHENVAVIRIDREVINALNRQLVDELTEALGTVADDASLRGVVVASANEKFFCIGLDIPYLFPLAREEFRDFYEAYNRLCLALYTLPKPTVAAVGGHAIAGGCILALCCDYRFIAEGRRLMGLNEIKLGVPVPYVGDAILRRLVGLRYAREIMDRGEFYDGTRLLEMGVVDRVLPSADLESAAIALMGEIGSYPPESFAMIKRNRSEGVAGRIAAALPAKQAYFVDCWFSAEARPRLEQAMGSFERG